jgi:hypothetical protein
VVEGSGDEGRIMWLTGTNKSLAIYNVDIDLSTAVSKDNARKNGIAIAASGEGNTISMIDVTVTGGTSASSGNLLYVGYGSSATLKNCAINDTKVIAAADGKGGTGGFAYIRGELTMTDCTVTGAGCATNGGAIYLYGESDTKKAHVTLTNCVFDNCVAGEFGGAIDVEKYADLEMINSTVKNCQSSGRAGAIHVNTGCTAELTNCTITGNTTTGKSRGGAIYNYQGTVTLLDCTVQNNSCTGTDPLGGGIYLYQADLTVGGKTVITGNKAADKESNVYTNGRKVIISTEKNLTKDSKIGVYSGAATVCSTATYAQKGLFSADKEGTMLVHPKGIQGEVLLHDIIGFGSLRV